MRRLIAVATLVAMWIGGCATTEEDVGGGTGGTGAGAGLGGSGNYTFGGSGGVGGSSATGGTGGSSASGGSGGTAASGGSGGFGGTGGSGGSVGDAAADVEAGSIDGFGPCVTQAEIDSQSSQPFQIGFCFNAFACFLCSSDAVNPGDIVCSPNCLCVPLPPLCTEDGGTDASSDAGDASADADADTDAATRRIHRLTFLGFGPARNHH